MTLYYINNKVILHQHLHYIPPKQQLIIPTTNYYYQNIKSLFLYQHLHWNYTLPELQLRDMSTDNRCGFQYVVVFTFSTFIPRSFNIFSIPVPVFLFWFFFLDFILNFFLLDLQLWKWVYWIRDTYTFPFLILLVCESKDKFNIFLLYNYIYCKIYNR